MRRARLLGSCLAFATVGLAAGLTGCPEPDGPDCDNEIVYNGRKVEGSIDLGKYGLKIDTGVEAVRAIDKNVERYLARWMTLCKDYKNDAMSRDDYQSEAKQLRDRMSQLEDLTIRLEAAVAAEDTEAMKLILRQLYVGSAEPSAPTDLQLEFAAVADSGGGFAPVSDGATLKTGDKLYFTVKLSQSAHVYMYQQTPDGEINVLFPHPQMAAANPLPAGTVLRIPPEPGIFTVNDKDIGSERVHVVASLKPMASFASQLQSASKGSAPALDCGARGLDYSSGQECPSSRGLDFTEGGGGATQGYTFKAANAAGDDALKHVFTFQHVP
jgi:hypothetical protein